MPLLALCLLPACTGEDSGDINDPSTLAFPMTLTDQAGREVRIEKLPETFVSLAPSNTEIVYGLQLDEKLVGVTEYCDYPEEAQSKPKIGGFSNVDIEKVVAIDPDLILATGMHLDEITPELEQLGFPVLTLAPQTLRGMLDALVLVGLATGQEEIAFEVEQILEKRIKAVTDVTDDMTDDQRSPVFYILWHDPLMTVSSSTLIHEIITQAGGINIAADLEGNYPTMNLETVLMADPEVIIVGSGHGSGEDAPYQFALTESRLAEVSARLNDRVYEIDADLVSRACPRLVIGLETMARLIHPELFEAVDDE
jgi:iron complex transport system substrate-binding protein